MNAITNSLALFALVPKRRLGTHVLEVLLPIHAEACLPADAKRSFAAVRSQAELGNENGASLGFLHLPPALEIIHFCTQTLSHGTEACP
jgi:hypothetical protein